MMSMDRISFTGNAFLEHHHMHVAHYIYGNERLVDSVRRIIITALQAQVRGDVMTYYTVQHQLR